MNATLHEHVYLVQIENGRYLVSVDIGRGEVEVTSFPSVATHYVYRKADELTQRMRKRGFRQSVVADVLGVPVSVDDLRAAVLTERSVQRSAEETLPRDQAELDRIPMAEIKRRWKQDAAFRQRCDEIEAQS